MALADSCSFLFSSSIFLLFFSLLYLHVISCASMCGSKWVGVGMRGCAWVCVSMHGHAWVYAGVCKCVLKLKRNSIEVCWRAGNTPAEISTKSRLNWLCEPGDKLYKPQYIFSISISMKNSCLGQLWLREQFYYLNRLY